VGVVSDPAGRSKVIMDSEQIGRTLARMTHEIAEQAPDLSKLALVGIHSGGVDLAARLAKLFKAFYEIEPPTGAIDITFYRDDLDVRLGREYGQPRARSTDLPFDVTGMSVVLVDDVLYTGRTIRAAMNELFDYGRPQSIRLAALIDRGGRQLPIAAQFVGAEVSASEAEQIELRKNEKDQLSLVLNRQGAA
jgi:pyrimidine operon attenuation protein/uracil phosphoribosyltransferase